MQVALMGHVSYVGEVYEENGLYGVDALQRDGTRQVRFFGPNAIHTLTPLSGADEAKLIVGVRPPPAPVEPVDWRGGKLRLAMETARIAEDRARKDRRTDATMARCEQFLDNLRNRLGIVADLDVLVCERDSWAVVIDGIRIEDVESEDFPFIAKGGKFGYFGTLAELDRLPDNDPYGGEFDPFSDGGVA
jgi:hypothetical protein